MTYHTIFWKNSVTPKTYIHCDCVCIQPVSLEGYIHIHVHTDIYKTKNNENTLMRLATGLQAMRRRFKHTPNHAELVMEAALRQCQSTSFSCYSFHQCAKLIHPSHHWRYIIIASGKILKYSMYRLIKPSISTTKYLEFVLYSSPKSLRPQHTCIKVNVHAPCNRLIMYYILLIPTNCTYTHGQP